MGIQINRYIASITISFNHILETIDGVSEDILRQNPTEDEWSVLQVLNHLNEATPYWLSEVEVVLNNPGEKWGRGLNDDDRLFAVESPETLNTKEVIDEIKKTKKQVALRLGDIDDERLIEKNPHRNFEKFGNKPVSFIIEHFIDEHTAGHLGQIIRNLSKIS